MNVDGPTPNGSPVPDVQRPNHRTPVEAPAPSTRTSKKNADRAGQGSSILRDSYEHVSTDSEGPATYGESTLAEGRVQRSSFDALQETVKQSYSAEIVDLETAVNAKGLPLRSEEDNTGVLKQDILRAYRKGDEESGGNSRSRRRIPWIPWAEPDPALGRPQRKRAGQHHVIRPEICFSGSTSCAYLDARTSSTMAMSRRPYSV